MPVEMKTKVTRDLHSIQINSQHKIFTLDIKDLYVNLPIQNIISVTKFWLNNTTINI